MLNLNSNFTQIKTNFIEPLKMIKSYIKKTESKGAGVIVSPESAMFIYKLGVTTTDFD